ncbi:MAG: outer membrane lipoprotein LolB [Gammaproteobacteria bacterium]|nr:outer membrane lipoprotein LolB [Gammaproteobacteria bacterium]
MKRLLLVVLTSSWLVACSSVPEPTTHTTVAAAAINGQQQQLQQLDQWRLRGQMALFDLRQDDRHGLYIDWFYSAELLTMRFSHPLRGTIARLEQRKGYAELVDHDDNSYYGRNAQELLQKYFNIDLPVDMLNSVVMGKQLPTMAETKYQLQSTDTQQLALLSDFVMVAADQLWNAQLRQYQPVNGIYVPHSIDLTAQTWRLKLKVSEWKF